MFDPHRLLTIAERAIVARSKAVGEDGGEERKAASGWGTAIIGLTVVAAIVVFGWLRWRRGKELAKLRHERNKARIEADNATLRKTIASSDRAADRLAARRRSLAGKVRIVDADIRAEEQRYEADLLAISRITSWDDVVTGVR